MSCLIRQTLAGRAFDRDGLALHVVDAKLGARVLAEIELGQIAVQMLFAAVLINTDHAALKDAVISLDGVGIYFVSIPVGVALLAAMMVNRSVLRELVAQLRICLPRRS